MSIEATPEQRLARLELSNKRLKAAIVGMLSLVAGAAILGAAAPAPKSISAERFVLIDANGNERAELSANSSAAALQFLNADKSRSLILASGSAGNGLILSDEKGKTRASMFSSDDGSAQISLTKANSDTDSFIVKDSNQGTALAFRDSNGKDRINIGSTNKGASLVVNDANETPRAMVAEQGVVTYLKGGQVEWASFGESLTPAERKRVMDIVNSGALQ